MKYLQEDSQCWWLADKFGKDPHDELMAHIERLKSNQAGRFENARRLMAAYERGSKHRFREEVDDQVLSDKSLAFNHARNAVDTVHCKWVKETVLPMMLTNGGGALERERAKNLEKAALGELRKNKWEVIEENATRDALVCNLGWAHVLHGQDSLTIDWVPFEDVLFDPAETRQKQLPRFMARRYLMDRYVAISKWGQKDEAFYGSKSERIAKLRKCKRAPRQDSARDQQNNVIEVWAAWHLGSGPDADDGAYAVVIDGCTLEFAEWDRDYIPLFHIAAFPRMRGIHGLSLMADFLPVQEEHDKLSQRIQKAHHYLGGTHIIAAREGNVDTRDLSNAQGTVIEFDATNVAGNPVKEFNPTPVNPQTYQYREGLISEMYASHGIPTMTATGQVPDGMGGASGKAFQEQEDQTAERLLIPFREKKRFLVAVTWGIVEEARAMVEDDPKYAVKFRGERRALEKIEWKKVLMDRDEFDIEIQAVNGLSKSGTERFKQLSLMLSQGSITPEQFRRLFGLPDLEAENEVDLADVEIIDKVMDQIVIEGKPLQPEPFDYLELIVQRGRKFYNLCRKKGVPGERLAYLRDYLTRAKQMNDEQKLKMQAQAPMGQMMPGGPVGPITPPGQPAPTPVAA